MKTILVALVICCTARAATSEPIVYLAQDPNFCANLSGDTYRLFVHSHDDPDFVRVRLNLEIGGTVSQPPVVYTQSGGGVTLEAVDTSVMPYSIELSWTPRALEHEPVATLLFPSWPTWDLGPLTTNVVFTRPGGETVPARDFRTFPGWPEGCHICYLCFQIEDHIFVPPGQTTAVPFGWSWWCYSPGGDAIVASDSRGWVSGWNPAVGQGNGYCYPCWADDSPGVLQITVPAGTPAGTTSSLRLEGEHNAYYCPGLSTIEVEGTVATAPTTWSRIKALYR